MIKVDMIVENVASVIISHFFSFSMLKSMCSDPANSKNDKTPCSTKSVKLSLSSIDSMISFMITAGVNFFQNLVLNSQPLKCLHYPETIEALYFNTYGMKVLGMVDQDIIPMRYSVSLYHVVLG